MLVRCNCVVRTPVPLRERYRHQFDPPEQILGSLEWVFWIMLHSYATWPRLRTRQIFSLVK